MKSLYLIDGYAQFFRAYHAIRTPMTSPVTGEPTNATFGFVGMLFRVLNERTPDYLAVALDVSGDRGTFRSQIYPEYKANRDAPPEDLGVQVDRCVSILEAINVPTIGAAGYEADDVIATIATRIAADDNGPAVRIVSKDKDLRQLLVPGRVDMVDVHTGDVMDADRLHEEFGITPDQVVDMLALMGDTVDNVPGVPGIGPKTAAKLIAEFGDLDTLMQRAETIKAKARREKLIAAADTLPLSKELVTLVRDVELTVDLEAMSASTIDLAPLEPILRELGFNRYRDELRSMLGQDQDSTASDSPKPSRTTRTKRAAPNDGGGLFDALEQDDPDAPAIEHTGDYQRISTKDEAERLIAHIREAGRYAFDTETTSVHATTADLVGMSFSTAPGTAAYVPVRSPEPETHLSKDEALALFKPLLEDDSLALVGHHLKYDALVMRRAGVRLRGIAGDSLIASALVDTTRSSHGMDHLALSLLGHSTIPISDLIGTGKSQNTFDTVDLERATIYAAEDADITLQLCDTLEAQLEEMGLTDLYTKTELPLLEVLAELEHNGIRVEPDELGRQSARLTDRIEELRRLIEEASPREFNPDSPKQLSAILFNDPDDEEAPGLGIKPIKKTKTGYSTDAEVLEKLASDPLVDSPVPTLIVEYRQLTKLVSTYLVALRDAIHPDTGRVHASFHQTIAATGRLSSSDPNLQNIPIRTAVGRDIRRAFVAEPGHMLVGGDYSQIELRVLAHLSKDPALIDAFQRGADIHRAVAAEVHSVPEDDVTREQRDGAKMVNFGIVYGITPFGLARRLGVSNEEATQIIDNYKQRFAGITTFLEECVEAAKSNGYVQTMLGRRRPITDIESRNPNRRALAERMAINSVVQGSAADLIKIAMVRMHDALRPSPGRPVHETAQPGSWASDAARVKMLLQIHDELVLEAPAEIADQVARWMERVMISAMDLRVPLVVEATCSQDWYDSK